MTVLAWWEVHRLGSDTAAHWWPRVVYMQCHGHALNVAGGDTVKQCKLMNCTIETTFEASKLVKFSPKRDFEKLKSDLAPDSPGFRVLCPTRWKVRAASLTYFIDNYTVIQELWVLSKDEVSNPSMKVCITAVEAQFKTFRHCFYTKLSLQLEQNPSIF